MSFSGFRFLPTLLCTFFCIRTPSTHAKVCPYESIQKGQFAKVYAREMQKCFATRKILPAKISAPKVVMETWLLKHNIYYSGRSAKPLGVNSIGQFMSKASTLLNSNVSGKIANHSCRKTSTLFFYKQPVYKQEGLRPPKT